jgi:hypothetical protein
MQRYLEFHDYDGVVLYYCFLKHFAGTNVENLIEAYQGLTETKLQLHLFQNNVPNFTNAVRKPIRQLMKAREEPSLQHFINVFHGVIECPNEEFRTFAINKYTEYRNGGPAKYWSMLDLLDRLDSEYARINALGRWEKGKNAEILALTAQISTLQKKISSMNKPSSTDIKKSEGGGTKIDPKKPDESKRQSNKPPNPPKPGGKEIIEFKGKTWKFCAKCFSSKGGTWNQTHVTADHKPKADPKKTSPEASATVANANLATTEQTQYNLDFV